MDFFDTLGRFDNYHQRTTSNGYHPSLRYPSPFLDIAHTYLPQTVKHMFRWCTYYYLSNPIINPIITNLSEYPITDIMVDETEIEIKKKWEEIINNQFDLKAFLIEVGLDYFAYGNAFVSIHLPFQKYLICSSCGHKDKIENTKYKFRGLKYRLSCKKCEIVADAKVVDENIRSIRDIRLIRWNPENIDIEHMHQIGHTEYFLTIPLGDRNDILMGKKHVIEKLPNIYIEAVRLQKRIKFKAGEIFHFARPIISQKEHGWGMPIIMPALKSCYYTQILRKAQEQIMNGCIVPLRVIFPQGGDAQSSPYLNVHITNWARIMQKELEKWRLDPNYIPIMPLPLGNEVIGGEGKSLALFQELELSANEICNAMGVPLEFLKGGLSWSGSNMSLKLLENKFHSYRVKQLRLCRDFILGRIADFMEWNRPKISFKGFKMADDLQRSALIFQGNQALKISDKSWLDSLDFDWQKEQNQMEIESSLGLKNQRRIQRASGSMQGELQILQAKYQALAQKKMMEMGVQPPPQDPGGQQGAGGPQQGEQAAQQVPGMPQGASISPENAQQQAESGVPMSLQSPLQKQQAGMDLGYLAREAANALNGMDENTKQMQLMNMKGLNQELYTSVINIMNSGKGSQANPLDPLQSPMPQVKPPRR